MQSISESVTVDAEPQEVWQILADVSILPSLSSSTKEVRVDGLLDHKGQTFTQTVRFGGRDWTSDWTVEDVEPGRSLVISGSLPGGTPYTMTEELTADGARTRLSIRGDYELPFGMLGKLIDRLGAEKRARSEMNEVLHGVARLAEERASRNRSVTDE